MGDDQREPIIHFNKTCDDIIKSNKNENNCLKLKQNKMDKAWNAKFTLSWNLYLKSVWLLPKQILKMPFYNLLTALTVFFLCQQKRNFKKLKIQKQERKLKIWDKPEFINGLCFSNFFWGIK